MSLERVELRELSAAHVAAVRTLACVDFDVLVEGVPLSEASATVITLVRPGPGVDVGVVPQVFFGGKAFPAGLAHERFLSCVRSLVIRQHVLLGEAGVTLVTRVRLLSRVNPAMHLER